MSSSTHEIELSESSFDVFLEEKVGSRPSLTVSATSDELMDWLKMSHRIRMMEVAFDRAYKGRQIRGFLHLCDGQEAVVVGTNAGLSPSDSITTAYRCHGYQLVRGGSDVKGIAAELFGFQEGCSEGKGGSMHLYSHKKKFWGGAGIVGAQVPVGAGVALAEAFLARSHGKEPENVSVVCFGDGAANQGQIHEAMNISALDEVGGHFPVVFMCENNLYGMGTSTKRHSANPEYYTMGGGLHIPGVRVDGMDTLAMREAVSWAKRHALSTGPIIIEALTYRFHGHSMSDPGLSYRSREEVQNVRKERDAIKGLSNIIIQAGIATEKDLKDVQKQVRAEVDAEIEEATKGSQPKPEAIFDHIYHNEVPHFIRGVERV